MQKIRFFFGLAALSLCCGSAWAQTTLTRDQALKLLSRPGRWIDTGGAPQDDGTYLASQIQIVAAADEAQMIDPAITGIVENLDPAKGTLTVLGYKITFDSNKTVFKDAKKKPIFSSKLENGMGVKVVGKLHPDGTFAATKIRLQSTTDEVTGAPVKPKSKVYGPVTVVDAGRGVLKVLNTKILLRPEAVLTEQPMKGK